MPKLSDNQVGDRLHAALEGLASSKVKPFVATPLLSRHGRHYHFLSKVS